MQRGRAQGEGEREKHACREGEPREREKERKRHAKREIAWRGRKRENRRERKATAGSGLSELMMLFSICGGKVVQNMHTNTEFGVSLYLRLNQANTYLGTFIWQNSL